MNSHLFTPMYMFRNFLNEMVLVCITMIDEENDMISIVSNSFGNLMIAHAC